MKTAIAIFAKTIGFSPVKTRLAKSIGTENAETFYRLSVQAVEAVVSDALQKNDALFPHWVLAEEETVDLGEWDAFPSLWTGEGGLGQRLARVSRHLFEEFDAVMFIGTDSPQLHRDVLLEAFEQLEKKPDVCVAGPAADGGFYLFASARPIAKSIWENVTYSAETTLSDLEDRIVKAGGLINRLTTQQDVDELEDLVLLKSELQSRADDLLAEQNALLDWLNDYFDVAV